MVLEMEPSALGRVVKFSTSLPPICIYTEAHGAVSSKLISPFLTFLMMVTDVFFPSAVCEDNENSGLISRIFLQALKELLGSVLGFFLALCHITGKSVFPNSWPETANWGL